MAISMRDIKRKIKSTQNSKQITKAMEMVAASRLRKSQELAQASRPYAEKLREVVEGIAAGSEGVKHPMLQSREVKKTAYLVISSDRGLAGGYNSNIIRKVTQTIAEKHKSPDEYVLFVVGRKARDAFRRRDLPMIEEITGLSDSPTFADIKPIASKAVRNYAEGLFDELYLVYNEFINAISQTPVIKRLLPLDRPAGGGSLSNLEYEPSAEDVLAVLLPKYAETLIYSAVLEGKASEFGARMTAMGNATKNASKMIADYTLQYNRARQAAITQEISEIVAGANALV